MFKANMSFSSFLLANVCKQIKRLSELNATPYQTGRLTMSMQHAQPPSTSVVYTQPGVEPPVGEAPGAQAVNGVTIRNLRDTEQDADFAGRLTVEAFREKFAHNITEAKIPIAIKIMAVTHRGQYDSFYRRTFVAEYEGRPVGVMQLNYKGEKIIERDDHTSELGCWHMLRFGCFGCVTDEKVPRHKCYLDHIAVDESARGKGVGKILMQRAEYEARQRGCTTIYLAVTTTNRAIHLYEREGYLITSRCGCLGCCIGPPGSVYVMEKQL